MFLEAIVSSQKTAFVCLLVFVAFLANGLVQLMSRTRAAVVIGQRGVSVALCVGAQRSDSCAVVVSVERRTGD